MQGKIVGKSSLKHPFLVQVLLGTAIMVAVAFVAAQSDIATTQRILVTTTNYVKEQCNRYARIELASETKSLMRVIESGKQIAHQIENEEGGISASDLQAYAQESYVTGIVLLHTDGTIGSWYDTEGHLPKQVTEALQSPALLDTAKHTEKRYSVRLSCEDQSEIDLAAVPCPSKNSIVVAYYHTPLEYIASFNLSVSSLLSGYNMDNDGTIVVSQGDRIVASNDDSLVGQNASDIPILRRINSVSGGNKLLHTNQRSNSFSQYFGLMERGRDFYVYSFLPERKVFPTTPRTLLYTLVAYILLLLSYNMVRWRAAQRAQKEFSEELQSKNQQLSVAIRDADRANAAKTSFLSRMSHDIRTPLNGIIGLLEIDAAHPDDLELIHSNREKMQIAADHLLSLINDVLQMSKLESGEITLAHEALDLGQLSNEVLTIIAQRAAESGITMVYDENSESLASSWVYGSPLHLRQIFLNIYTNCIKYNKVGGSISTQIQCMDKTEHTLTYRWTITDTGIGMSEEFLRHIFDPFTQENTDARSVYQGTGLGMTIVKGLVEQMHGCIEVSSKEDVGSTFIITIPFEIAAPAKTEDDADTVQDADIRGLHLLLAEDNALNAEIAQTILEDAGAVVTIVGDGQQAVDLFEKSPADTFDAILMDMMMPVMDGLTATKTIRSLDRPDAKTIPIISMTANAFAEDAEKCLAAGMNAHLAKPLDVPKLIKTISQFIPTNASRRNHA